MKQITVALLILIALVPLASATSRRGEVEQELHQRIVDNLSRHVDGEAITAWRDALNPGSLERDAADWILAWLPAADLTALDLTLLSEHVCYAARVYREAPWRESLSHDLWLHFIVPHRVSQEPAQPWRARFHADIWPRVAGAASMEEAALEVNRWCREQATFRSTSGRDMGPLTTIKRGLGRCEEEMILSISALRSVGLPARSCATPYWTFTDNNHAWVEVWADGNWQYLGACEPNRCLSNAWFTNAARRAGFVRSVAYGELDPKGEPLYRREKGATLINSTSVYTTPFTLAAALAADIPERDTTTIHVNVLNFGNLRSIAKIEPGGSLELGPGEYALTAQAGEDLLLKVIGGKPGESVAVTLGTEDTYDFENSPGFWLRYPEAFQAPRRDLDLVDPGEKALSDLRVKAAEADRRKLRTPSAAEQERLDSLDAGTSERLAAILDKPLDRVSTIFLLLDHYTEPERREALIAFLEQADDKDLLELGEEEIRSHLDMALAVRHRLEPAGLVLPDSIFASLVLRCRIEREPGSAWRRGLPLLPIDGDARAGLDALLAAFRDRMELREGGFFGPPLDPAQSWRLGGGGKRDLGIALVGLLRRNGFPARYRHGKTEVWLGEFEELDPTEGKLKQDVADGEASAATGRLEIAITRGGLPYAEAESYKHFNVGRISDGKIDNPWWDPQLGEQDWDAGDYVLCSVLRVPGGSAYGRLRAFTVAPGAHTRVTLPVTIETADWDAASALFDGPDSGDVLAVLAELPGAESEPLPENGLLFAFTPGEPATRMLTAIANLRPRLTELEIPLLPLLVGHGESQDWRELIAADGWSAELRLDPEGKLLALGEGGQMEPLVLLRYEGEIHLLRQGFDTAIDGTVHIALDLLGAPR